MAAAAVFANATQVTVNVPFKDSQGNVIVPTAASYRVLDEAGTELVAATSASVGADPIPVVVPAAKNTLAAGTPQGYRTVEMSFTIAGGTVVATPGYIVESGSVLIIMTNSYQTFGSAEMHAAALQDLKKWDDKTERERKMAMIQAYHRLGTLTYKINDRVTDQSSIDFGKQQTVLSINRLTVAQFDLLLATFRDAIKRAQVAEADVILDNDSIIGRRRDGLMSESVGETSQFFRPSKPLTLPVSNRALRELQGFVHFSGTLARAS